MPPRCLQHISGDLFEKLEDEDEQGWCKGRKNGKIGLYPANYAEVVWLANTTTSAPTFTITNNKSILRQQNEKLLEICSLPCNCDVPLSSLTLRRSDRTPFHTCGARLCAPSAYYLTPVLKSSLCVVISSSSFECLQQIPLISWTSSSPFLRNHPYSLYVSLACVCVCKHLRRT